MPDIYPLPFIRKICPPKVNLASYICPPPPDPCTPPLLLNGQSEGDSREKMWVGTFSCNPGFSLVSQKAVTSNLKTDMVVPLVRDHPCL